MPGGVRAACRSLPLLRSRGGAASCSGPGPLDLAGNPAVAPLLLLLLHAPPPLLQLRARARAAVAPAPTLTARRDSAEARTTTADLQGGRVRVRGANGGRWLTRSAASVSPTRPNPPNRTPSLQILAATWWGALRGVVWGGVRVRSGRGRGERHSQAAGHAGGFPEPPGTHQRAGRRSWRWSCRQWGVGGA